MRRVRRCGVYWRAWREAPHEPGTEPNAERNRAAARRHATADIGLFEKARCVYRIATRLYATVPHVRAPFSDVRSMYVVATDATRESASGVWRLDTGETRSCTAHAAVFLGLNFFSPPRAAKLLADMVAVLMPLVPQHFFLMASFSR